MQGFHQIEMKLEELSVGLKSGLQGTTRDLFESLQLAEIGINKVDRKLSY